jgi:hypothetical protein
MTGIYFLLALFGTISASANIVTAFVMENFILGKGDTFNGNYILNSLLQN